MNSDQQNPSGQTNQRGSSQGNSQGGLGGQQNQQSAEQQGQAGGSETSGGQQQQFDSSGGGQQGGGQQGGSSGQFAGQIQPHMTVTGSDGWTCGTVDHIDGDRIKLTKDDSGQHRYIPMSLVERVENDQVTLRERGDQAFGMSGE